MSTLLITLIVTIAVILIPKPPPRRCVHIERTCDVAAKLEKKSSLQPSDIITAIVLTTVARIAILGSGMHCAIRTCIPINRSIHSLILYMTEGVLKYARLTENNFPVPSLFPFVTKGYDKAILLFCSIDVDVRDT
ncbi:hypothetical protein POVWA2_055440 [Plasmodium ovale wallikeri]|uniref:PIR Superfamily Protein n=1 Tax=Plasmodium ovale wallikeri TaxID=864142 RepID=A0A1A8ZUD1_PLAOA|nr:hypothetical protein POVWA1_055740 [Plasmodium ovale wallikeri]SBT48179.1 hypothetical protein POVWA2_055440 [Plasmodium ovale wallikeri]